MHNTEKKNSFANPVPGCEIMLYLRSLPSDAHHVSDNDKIDERCARALDHCARRLPRNHVLIAMAGHGHLNGLAALLAKVVRAAIGATDACMGVLDGPRDVVMAEIATATALLLLVVLALLHEENDGDNGNSNDDDGNTNADTDGGSL